MKIKDIMTREVISITPNIGIVEIYNIFREKRIGGLPVIDKKGDIVGIVTKKELLAVMLPDYFTMIEDFLFVDDFGALDEELENLPELNLFLAEDLMVKEVATIDEDASLLKAPVIMHKYNIKHLPVVKGKKLVGVVTRSNILKALIERKGGL